MRKTSPPNVIFSVTVWAVVIVVYIVFFSVGCDRKQDLEIKQAVNSGQYNSEYVKDIDKRIKVPFPNVIFLVVDALRADHLGCYGYSRNTSPNIDEFSFYATVFTNAQSTAPWTLPSHTSMFTGLYPQEHHVVTNDLPANVKKRRDNYYKQNIYIDCNDISWRQNIKNNIKKKFGEKAFKDLLRKEIQPLPEHYTTIAEQLRTIGYQTAAFAANSGYLDKRYQLDQGFETYNVKWGRVDDINEKVFRWLDKRNVEQPFFLFVNYMDTHVPYNDKPCQSFLNGKVIVENSNKFMRQFPPILKEKKGCDLKIKDSVPTVIDQYDLGIANADKGIAKLFDKLRNSKIFDDSLIIVTSDHGESLGEHGLITHSKDVYQANMRVPLLIKAPEQNEGHIVNEIVSTVFIPGIILNNTTWAKRNPFRHNWRSCNYVFASNYYTRIMGLLSPYAGHFERIRQVVYWGDYKYIDSSDGKNELYNLKSSPQEKHNIIGKQKSVALHLKQILLSIEKKNFVKSPAKQDRPKLSPGELGRFKTLGYL